MAYTQQPRLEVAIIAPRKTLLALTLLICLIGSFGYTNDSANKQTAEALLQMACGGFILNTNKPPEFIPEIRAAAANALAEQVLEARKENFLLPIDNASLWEAAAGQGPNPECRALGPILLPQIYVDLAARPDNPLLNPEFGVEGFVSAVLFPPPRASRELTESRALALAIACRGTLYGGGPSDVIDRLEQIVGGNRADFSCLGANLFFDGSNPAIRRALEDSLKGAYLSQLGPIAFAGNLDDPLEISNKVCDELRARATHSGRSVELRGAAAEAFVQGNTRSNLPAEFTFRCVEDLEQIASEGGILADAATDLLAKSLAAGGSSIDELRAQAAGELSRELQEAYALALGIRWASQFDVDDQTGNLFIDGMDLIQAVTANTGSPIAAAYRLSLSQAWAGQAMDTAGNCIEPGGLTDCILTTNAPSATQLFALTDYARRASRQAHELNPETNYKVISDREISDFVLWDERFEGLDILPLSAAKPGGILTFGATDLFQSALPIGTVSGNSFGWTTIYVHDSLLEGGFDRAAEGALAEFFEVSDDGEHVLFQLRRGVRWSDHTPFSAYDVIFSAKIPMYCVPFTNQETGEKFLVPFFQNTGILFWSTDGTCAGLPVVLTDTAFISPGPNGQIDSIPAGDDALYGSRILPAAAPLTLGEASDNSIVGAMLDSTAMGDDVVVEVAANQIAVAWSRLLGIVPAEVIGFDSRFCCYPEHILRDSLISAIANGDPGIFLERWDLDELRQTPETLIGTGPFVLEEFGHGTTHSVIWRRNPNYWKVDEAGGLLPKLDGLHAIEYFGRPDAKLQAFLDGQLDTFAPTVRDKIPLQQEMEERGIEYFLADRPSTSTGFFTVLNGTVDQYDPTKEALAVAFRNPEFRRAFSQAWDRKQEANVFQQGDFGVQYVGGRPLELDISAPICPVSFNFPELAEFCDVYQNIEDRVSHDLDAANARFDALGLTTRNEDEIRIIPAGFGYIVPGPNGVLDSSPMGDDVVVAGLEISGLGLSDRDGDGVLDADPGIIQPGPNGILDTEPSEDDYADVTSIAGLLSWENIENDIAINRERQNEFETGSENLALAGVGVTVNLVPTNQRAFRLFGANPPEFESATVGDNGTFSLSQGLDAFYRSCARLHIYKRLDCQEPDSREPYQVRIDEIWEEARFIDDEETLARLHAELQLLQAANMPMIFRGNSRSIGAIRSGQTNAPAVPQGVAALFFSEFLFRLDLQN